MHGEQTTGWTVPLLHTHLAQAGYPISQRTLRRTLHRLGWRWKRPKYVLGRPDPAYEEKKGRWSPTSSRREVWIGDEMTVWEFPPLRCAWAKQGEQQVVIISGRNGRRLLHGALNIQTGELVKVVRERSRTHESQAFVEALGQMRPELPKLLIWDNEPPHHPKRGQEAAAVAKIEITWLPFRSPELNPCEDLWRVLKVVMAANRAYASLEEEVEQTVAWLDGLTNEGRLRCCGLKSSKFLWLST